MMAGPRRRGCSRSSTITRGRCCRGSSSWACYRRCLGHRDRLRHVHRQPRRLDGDRRPRCVLQRSRLATRPDGGAGPRRLSARRARGLAAPVPDDVRRLSDARALEGAPLHARPEPQLLPGRVRRPRLAEGDADGARRARQRHQDHGRRRLHRRLFHRHRVSAGDERPVAGRSSCSPGWRPTSRSSSTTCRVSARSARAGRRARADDRPRRRQLHQHPDGQALRPHHARARLRPFGDERVPADGQPAGADVHVPVAPAHRPQLGAAGGRRRRRHLWLAAVADDCRRHHGRARPRHAAPRHVAVDHVGSGAALREHRHGRGRHHHAVEAGDHQGQAGCHGARRSAR